MLLILWLQWRKDRKEGTQAEDLLLFVYGVLSQSSRSFCLQFPELIYWFIVVYPCIGSRLICCYSLGQNPAPSWCYGTSAMLASFLFPPHCHHPRCSRRDPEGIVALKQILCVCARAQGVRGDCSPVFCQLKSNMRSCCCDKLGDKLQHKPDLKYVTLQIKYFYQIVIMFMSLIQTVIPGLRSMKAKRFSWNRLLNKETAVYTCGMKWITVCRVSETAVPEFLCCLLLFVKSGNILYVSLHNFMSTASIWMFLFVLSNNVLWI